MKIRFDNNLDSYQGFFDHSWMKQLSILTIDSQLENATMALGASWKGASNVRRMPWLMMIGLKDAVENFSNYHQPIPIQVLSVLIEKIAKGLERNAITLIGSERRALIKEIQQIETELLQGRSKNPLEIDEHHLWRQYLGQDEFLLCLWMSEINAYCSIYFAYENFLINAIKTLGKFENLRSIKLAVKKTTELFDNELTKILWKDETVKKARLIRNALVHNGGKITDELKRYSDQLLLEDGQIVIMPEQTNQLYSTLKDKITRFCQIAIRSK